MKTPWNVGEPDPESGRMHWYAWNADSGQQVTFVEPTSSEEERQCREFVESRNGATRIADRVDDNDFDLIVQAGVYGEIKWG